MEARAAGPGAARMTIYGALLVLAALVVAAAAAILTSAPIPVTTTTQPGQPATVSVFGLVGTTGAGTVPQEVVFVSVRTSTAYAANVSAGHFSVDLPNPAAYNVTLRWQGNYSWQAGEVFAGTLSLNKSAGSNPGESYNLVLPSPETVVMVSGTIPWQVVTSAPVQIRFTAGDGENFTAPVTDGNAFALKLPNLMTYEVYVQSRNSTGYTDWFYAHTLEVEAGVNVLGLTVRISS